tara:strand:+ start:3921 stop:4787 length:867 start_codon:yes stop_codon:yes gene_type:complete
MNLLKKVTVVIVLYKETIDIISTTLNEIKDLDIIIVDNDSNNELKNAICSEFNIKKYILNKKNVGFSAGYNQGIKLSKNEFILILGPDCIISKQSIETLLKKYEKYSNAVIVAPTSYDKNKNLSYTGGLLPENGDKNLILTIDGDACVESVLGSCMLLKKKDTINDQLFFDENFFLYFSDDDLCRRVKKNKNAVIQTKDATCVHQHGIIKVKNKYEKIFIRNFHYNYDQFYYFFKANKHGELISSFERKSNKLYLKFIIKLLLFRFSDCVSIISRLFAYYKFKSKYLN